LSRFLVRLTATLTLAASATALAGEFNGTFARRVVTPTDRVIIKWRDTAQLSIAGGDVPDRVTRLAAATGLGLRSVRAVAPRLELLRLDQPLAAAALDEALAQLAANPAVEYAVADQRRWPHAIPSDALFGGQWFLQSNQPAATRASIAWDTTTGSTGTVVAVLDTGVRFEHPDLARADQAGKLLPGFDFIAGSGGSVLVANDGDGRDADASDPGDWIDSADIQDPEFADCALTDSSWHGTRVSGIIGARTDNGIGVAGEGWNAWILPMRVMGKCGGFDSDIISAMRWAAGLSVSGVPANPYPAKILNLSLGSASSCPQSYVDVVAELATHGVLVIASAGNDGSLVNAPANCSGVLAVSAIRHVGTKVGFSSLGPLVGISAPGGNCVNIGAGEPCLFTIDTTIDSGLTGPAGSTYTDQFDFNVGTSFSAPIVAGAAALMHAVNARLGPELLIARLKSAAAPFPVPSTPPPGGTCHVPTGPGDVQIEECVCTTLTCGAGMLDTSAAVAQAMRPIADIAAPVSVMAGQNVSLDGSSSAAACNRTLTTYAWTVAPGSVGAPVISGADQPIATVQAPNSGSFTLRLTVTDSSGAQDFADVTVTPTAAATTAIAPLPGNACPTPITVQQVPPPAGGGSGGGGGGGALVLEIFALALLLARRRPSLSG
jgi:serine protease